MPGQLIYRCYRLPGQGYLTLASEDRDEASRRADDAVLQALRDGQPPLGCTGLVWPVVVEGRDAVEVLAFVHGLSLSPQEDASLVARLEGLLRVDLTQALDAIAEDRPARSVAIARISGLLQISAREVSTSLPARDTRAQPFAKAPERQRFRLPMWTACALAFAVVGVGFAAFWWSGSTEVPQIGGPSLAEIAKLAEPCHPGIAERQDDLARLEQVLTTATWRPDDGALIDYARGLPMDQAGQLSKLEMAPDQLCRYRSEMWNFVASIDRADEALNQLKDVPGVQALDLQAVELLEGLVDFTKTDPPPPRAPDCAAGICLPLVAMEDIALKHWSDRLSQTIQRLLGVDAGAIPGKLHDEEIRLRGMLSLAGEDPRAIPANPFWECDLETCHLPLLDSEAWLALN